MNGAHAAGGTQQAPVSAAVGQHGAAPASAAATAQAAGGVQQHAPGAAHVLAAETTATEAGAAGPSELPLAVAARGGHLLCVLVSGAEDDLVPFHASVVGGGV